MKKYMLMTLLLAIGACRLIVSAAMPWTEELCIRAVMAGQGEISISGELGAAQRQALALAVAARWKGEAVLEWEDERLSIVSFSLDKEGLQEAAGRNLQMVMIADEGITRILFGSPAVKAGWW